MSALNHDYILPRHQTRADDMISQMGYDEAKHNATLLAEWLNNNVKYKNGYTFRFYVQDDTPLRTRIMMVINACVPDAYNAGHFVTVGSSYLLSHEYFKNARLKDAMGVIRRSLHKLEEHEADEWFLVQGERLFDPHA